MDHEREKENGERTPLVLPTAHIVNLSTPYLLVRYYSV